VKEFTIKQNDYLNKDIQGYYNCDYVGYQKKGNPDFINHLKNMSKRYNELNLVNDFISVCDISGNDLQEIVDKEHLSDFIVCVVPRSKSERKYSQSQLLFKKAISSTIDKLGYSNGTSAIKRVKDTKTTHDWRLENNSGENPYIGITRDTCEINQEAISDKNIILVDDVYTDGVNVAEDCIQTLLDLGAKSVILYIVAKTRS
jgi:predicted amidophosphoribosyltransferase